MSRNTFLKSAVAAFALAGVIAACAPSSQPAKEEMKVAESTPAPAPAPAPAPPPATVVDAAMANPDFSTLVTAITAAGLGDTLKGAGPFTVFAPSNAAFAKLPAGTVEGLLKPEKKADLAKILTMHVVPGRIMAADLAGKTETPATVQGAKLKVDTATAGVVKINGATVVSADVATGNGVIHVIDTVILP
jgi:uncharacterized surface protein with fasciclin (FAS1) repeats